MQNTITTPAYGHAAIAFTANELAAIKATIAPNAQPNNANGILLGNLGDLRPSTYGYVLYKHDDGYRLRRLMHPICTPFGPGPFIYQLFRNAHNNTWPALPTLQATANKLKAYIAKYGK